MLPSQHWQNCWKPLRLEKQCQGFSLQERNLFFSHSMSKCAFFWYPQDFESPGARPAEGKLWPGCDFIPRSQVMGTRTSIFLTSQDSRCLKISTAENKISEHPLSNTSSWWWDAESWSTSHHHINCWFFWSKIPLACHFVVHFVCVCFKERRIQEICGSKKNIASSGKVHKSRSTPLSSIGFEFLSFASFPQHSGVHLRTVRLRPQSAGVLSRECWVCQDWDLSRWRLLAGQGFLFLIFFYSFF